MNGPLPCTRDERGLLGVGEKYTLASPIGGRFPEFDIPTWLPQGIECSKEPYRGIVGIHADVLVALENLAFDTKGQAAKRENLLRELGFDAAKPYSVIYDTTTSVYYFCD